MIDPETAKVLQAIVVCLEKVASTLGGLTYAEFDTVKTALADALKPVDLEQGGAMSSDETSPLQFGHGSVT